MPDAARPLRLFVVAGEASGDLLGAEVVRALYVLHPTLDVQGMGGPSLEAAGMQCLVKAGEVSVVGLAEVVKRLSRIWRAFRRLEAAIHDWRPDALLLIDLPDFNLRLARAVRRMPCPILYYVSPQLWAWRSGRIRTIARCVDHMMVIFPFEAALYEKAGVPVTFVGHPLLDSIPRPALSEESAGMERAGAGGASDRLDLDPAGSPVPNARLWPDQDSRGGHGPAPRLALLPGSREGEVAAILPWMLKAAAEIARRTPVQCLVAQAPGLEDATVQRHLSAFGLPVGRVVDKTLEVLRTADVALVASGTATLEAALLERPMVVVYRVSWITYAIARLLVHGVRSIAIVNLIAGRTVVPERIQFLKPSKLAPMVLRLLESPSARSEMRSDLRDIRGRLGTPGASGRVARIVLDHMIAAALRGSSWARG